MIDKRFAGISDEDLWAEWVRRRAVIRRQIAKDYDREYKRQLRAGMKKGERGIHLMTMKHSKPPHLKPPRHERLK